jgi:O-antigen ligase
MVALFLTGSNGAMLSVVIGCVVVSLMNLARRFGAAALVASVCLLATIACAAVFTPLMATVREAALRTGNPVLVSSIGRDSSVGQREILVRESYDLVQGAAPWGRGPRTTKPLLTDTLAPYAKEAHDDYIETIIERGAIGVIGLLLLIGSIAVRTWCVVREPLQRGFAEVVADTSPLAAGVVGLAVDASYYQIQHFRHAWTLLAIVAALHLWGLRSRSSSRLPDAS